MTHLIRENTGRERPPNEKEREREKERREEREELIRERPSEIMYTSKMMATVHAMDSRKKKAEGGVFLCRERRFGEIADIYRAVDPISMLASPE